MGIGGVLPSDKFVHTKPESEFLNNQAESSWLRTLDCMNVPRSD